MKSLFTPEDRSNSLKINVLPLKNSTIFDSTPEEFHFSSTPGVQKFNAIAPCLSDEHLGPGRT